MKILIVLLLAVSFLGCIVFGIALGFREYNYSVRIGQYLKIADDASTPALKLEYLRKYRGVVQDAIVRDSARYIFHQERLTKKVQLANLDSLIKRLADIEQMPPDSLAYQQGMSQITGQEFDHTFTEIDGVFYGCYMRDSFNLRYGIGVFLVLSVIGVFVWGWALVAGTIEMWWD
jgi:hypothetical protein